MTLTIPSPASAWKNFYLQCGTVGNLHLKRSHPYFTQVQFEMAITKREFADFVVFTVSESGSENIFVERITFSEEFWSKTLLLAPHKFFSHFMVLDLLTRRVFRGVKLVAQKFQRNCSVHAVYSRPVKGLTVHRNLKTLELKALFMHIF